METTAEQCKKKIISLLASFRREKNKTKQGTSTGKGRDEVYCSRWFAYEAFRFLEDRDLPQKRLATELDDVNEVALSSEQMEQEAIPETPTLPSTSKSTKRSKTKQDNVSSPIMSDAFQILKKAAKKMDKEPTQPSEIDLFFNFVAAKVQKYPLQYNRQFNMPLLTLLLKLIEDFLIRLQFNLTMILNLLPTYSHKLPIISIHNLLLRCIPNLLHIIYILNLLKLIIHNLCK
ncbi:unnamed protein product [Acanthoscelides obtectus]|uniref:MADF domain-containing protein n=1 Tax=Acanthoscelides obtectus TaxID=200917 RepID=A0A9P0JZE1_ACAOB|nr:unnamed protein product [Acanthoscelides obtectus]CAK1647052.1 hypothetical protein AOBTE_LOCUS15022 [Acanthoscelides obtectus]